MGTTPNPNPNPIQTPKLKDEGWGPTVRNLIRWTVLLVVGAGTGALVCAADANSKHQIWDFVRSAAITEIPVVAALKTQLEKALGIGS